MRTGSTVPVFVLASDSDTLIVAVVPKGQIVAVPKRDVFDVRVVLTPPVQHFSLPDPHEFPPELPRPCLRARVTSACTSAFLLPRWSTSTTATSSVSAA
jgi:hypothetical protein